MVHEVNIFTEFYSEYEAGRMKASCRFNDRPYAVGDTFIGYEFNGLRRTGRSCTSTITHIFNKPGIQDDYVVLSLERVF